MRTPSTKTRRLIVFGVGPLAIIAAGLLVWSASTAAFTAQTRNVGSNWDTGSVTLSDDDLGAAAFQLTNVTPGETGSQCIRVTSTSSVAGTVKLYIDRLGAQGLENNIMISTELGDGGTFGNCSSFVATSPPLASVTLANAATAYAGYATGVLPWATTGDATGEYKTYRVTWVFDTTGLSQTDIDALQGKSVSADVVWELQSK